MRRMAWACVIAAMLWGVPLAADANSEIMGEILALERQAMDGWRAGNPDPTLANSAEEITYFHAMTGGRLAGLATVRELYEKYRGAALFDSYEIVEPKVQGGGDTVVLSYVLVRHNGDVTSRWNATQVYQRTPEGWKVIHSHWSMTNPPRTGAPQR